MLTMQSRWPISVSSSSFTSPEVEVFVFGVVVCVFQVSGESAARGQRSQQEEQLRSLQQQLSQAVSVGPQSQVSAVRTRRT